MKGGTKKTVPLFKAHVIPLSFLRYILPNIKRVSVKENRYRVHIQLITSKNVCRFHCPTGRHVHFIVMRKLSEYSDVIFEFSRFQRRWIRNAIDKIYKVVCDSNIVASQTVAYATV